MRAKLEKRALEASQGEAEKERVKGVLREKDLLIDSLQKSNT